MDMKKLWKSRASTFWGEVIPYFKYVASSGLAAFMFIFFILSIRYYALFLNALPENFPVHLVALGLLLPALVLCPIRTYMKPADIIFLLPAETQMSGYINVSKKVSYLIQFLILSFLWVALWPLYRASQLAEGALFFIILFILLITKWTNIYGYWQELQFQNQHHRTFYVIFRVLLTIIILYMLFTYHFIAPVVIISAVLMLIYIGALKWPTRFIIHWERLIDLEKKKRGQYYTFLSWFVEVPEILSKVHRRSLLSKTTNWISFRQSNTYLYLYLKTFIRSDMLGMVTRLTILGAVIIFFLHNDYFKLAVFIFFIYLTGVQLSALVQAHQYMFWTQIYPISVKERRLSVYKLIRSIHIHVLILLSIVLAFTMSEKIYALGTILCIMILFIFHYFKKSRLLT